MTEWRPIKTAPMDGTMLLLFNKDWAEKRLVGSWIEQFKSWYMAGGGDMHVPPTHWCPLPEDPKK